MSPDETAVEQTAAHEYLAGVRAALADLPTAEVGEIVEDVRGHLDDMTGELGESPDLAALTARLGTPADYAAELRAAAGYPAPTAVDAPAPKPSGGRWALAGLLVGAAGLGLGTLARNPVLLLVGVLAPLFVLPLVVRDGTAVPTVARLRVVGRFRAAQPPEGTTARSVSDFVGSLQPAWWLLRALIAVMLVGAVLGGSVVLVVLAVVAIPVSVWLGYASRRDRRWLWLVVPLNALAVVLVPVGFDHSGFPTGSPTPAYSASPPSGLYQDDGQEIRDIRPVDATGKPLTGVYLFDQDGRPVDTRVSRCFDANGRSSAPTTTSQVRPYPRGTVEWDSGGCRTVAPGPLVVAIPSAPTSAPTSVVSSAPTSAEVPTPSLSPVPPR